MQSFMAGAWLFHPPLHPPPSPFSSSGLCNVEKLFIRKHLLFNYLKPNKNMNSKIFKSLRFMLN